MISQVEVSHGAALSRLCRWSVSCGVQIRRHPVGRSAYVLNERVGLYLKYSSSRLSPWGFSFADDHQGEVAGLADELGKVFIALICGSDGIACLSYREYKRLLDDDFRPVEWIKATRRPSQKYTLTGSDSVTAFKIGDNEYPAKVYAGMADGAAS